MSLRLCNSGPSPIISKENSFLYFENVFINFERPFSLVKRQTVTI